MKDNEINIKIAELRGWTQIKNANTMAVCGMWVGYPPVPIIGKKESIPNYTHNLNLCAEFEKDLFGTKHEDHYFSLLMDRAEDDHDSGRVKGCSWHRAISASAKQRCLAYIKVMKNGE